MNYEIVYTKSGSHKSRIAIGKDKMTIFVEEDENSEADFLALQNLLHQSRVSAQEQQLNTLFGDEMIIVGNCYVCESPVPDTKVPAHFLEGMKVWCETCDDWRSVSLLLVGKE